MPILNFSSMSKMVELSGREIPEEVLARLEPLRDDPAAVRAEGIAIATELCDTLLAGGAPGPALLHAEPLQGDARDLRRPVRERLSGQPASAALRPGPIYLRDQGGGETDGGQPGARAWRARRP